MAALLIRIEESHRDEDDEHQICGFSIHECWDGDLSIGDMLPGIRPALLRAVQNALDALYGSPVSVSNESIDDVRKRAFIN